MKQQCKPRRVIPLAQLLGACGLLLLDRLSLLDRSRQSVPLPPQRPYLQRATSGLERTRLANPISHLAKPTLFKCEQAQMGLGDRVQVWDLWMTMSRTLKACR